MKPEELDPNPIVELQAWLAAAQAVSPIAAAMTLATATPDGRPSARVVLLRGLDERGLVFFTNRESRKGAELAENPRAAVVFHWWDLGRQVRIEGDVEQVAELESVAYWRSRPRPSQLAAWVSPQSRPLPGREALETSYASAEAAYDGSEIPLPPFWGGYRLRPTQIEFWLHHDDRLHDRVRYLRTDSGWDREVLAP